MHPNLLKTKLFIPQTRKTLVQRPHLYAQLDQALDAKLTLVSAPAGFGKTTLAAQWLEQFTADLQTKPQSLALNPGWISLDVSDNQPIQFAHYFLAALQQAESTLATPLSPLLEGEVPFSNQFITVLINELVTLEHHLLLVLDDYHVIDNHAIHTVLTFLLEHAPPQLHLLIVTRADPPLPLAHLRARRQLLELRADDLRFSLTEAEIFLNQIMHLQLVTEDVTTLEARTEGWIASLQLAAVAMQSARIKPAARHQFVTSFAGTDRYIVDYLVGEVLQQHPDLELFLLHTAVLDRFCASLCDALCQVIPDSVTNEVRLVSQALLDRLERANLFLIPLDHERQWYRYHHLFRDLLRYRLQERFPERLSALHNQASHWFEQNDLVEEAITHALAAETYERAADLIETVAHATFSRGKMPTIRQWMAQLPPTLILIKPQLYMVQGWLLFRTGQFQELQTYLQTPPTIAGVSLAESPSTNLYAEYLILCANSAFVHGQFTMCEELVAQAMALLPPENLALRMPATTLLAWCSEYQGDLSTAVDHHQRALAMGYQSDSLTGTIASLGMLTQVYARQGDYRQTATTFAQVCQVATERNAQWIPLLGPAYIGMGHAYYQQGNVEEAIQHLQEGLARCRQWAALSIIATRGYRLLAEILQNENRHAEASALLAEIQHFIQSNHVPSWLMNRPSTHPTTHPQLLEPLTEREQDVLQLLVKGYATPRIADELIIGVSTVRTHVKRIYDKLDVHSRAEAIARTRELGLV